MFRQLVVFCATISVALGAVAIAQLEEKPEKYKDVEGCYIGKLDTVIPIDEAKPSNDSCMEYRCHKDYVQYVTCGVVAPPCKLVKYQGQSYPDCCKAECPEKQPVSDVNKEECKEEEEYKEESEECSEVNSEETCEDEEQ